MKVLRVCVMAMLLCISFTAYADSSNIVVRFINGVWVEEKCGNKKSCAEKNTKALKSVLHRNYGIGLDVGLSYNEHEGYLKDGYEATVQATKSDAGLKKLSEFFIGDVQPDWYDSFLAERKKRHSEELWEHVLRKKFFSELLKEQSKSQFRIANSTPIVLAKDNLSVPKSLKRLADEMAVTFYASVALRLPDYENSTEHRNYIEILTEYKQLLAGGKGVVVVCHSQGCFIANKIAKELDSPYLKIVAVATPASFVYGGSEYVTLETDLIINYGVKTLKVGMVLKPNIRNGKRYTNGHSFIEDYLTGKNSREKIVELVGEAIREIEQVRKVVLFNQKLQQKPLKTRKEKESICNKKGMWTSYAGDELKKRLNEGWIWWPSEYEGDRRMLVKPPSQEACGGLYSRFGIKPSAEGALYDSDGCRHTHLFNPIKMKSVGKKLCGG